MSLRSPLVPKWRRRTGAANLVKWQRTDIWWCHFELHSVLQLVGEDTFSSSSMATCPVMSSAELSCFHLLSNVLTGGGAYSFTAADHNAFSGSSVFMCHLWWPLSEWREKTVVTANWNTQKKLLLSPLMAQKYHPAQLTPESSQKAQESLTCVWPSKALQESCDEINKMWNIKLYSLMFLTCVH